MPRHRRIALPHLPHHIVQRGHNRNAVFNTSADRTAYLETLAEFRGVSGIRVYGYCLMTNHVHLIVDPGAEPANLGRLMKRLAGRHTRRINRLTQRTGTAWNGRYRCSPIETDAYLLACNRYVELNPVRAGLVAHPVEYPWSSYRAKVGFGECAWLDLDPVYLALGRSRERRQAAYRDIVGRDVPPAELELIRTALQRNQLTGSDRFISEVERRFGRRIAHRGPGRQPSEESMQTCRCLSTDRRKRT